MALPKKARYTLKMASPTNQWLPFEHQLYRLLQTGVGGKPHSVMLMVSGGADSMAMLAAFEALKSALRMQISVLHCHHGEADSSRQTQYRDRAARFVQSFCESKQIPFYQMKHKASILKSESELREFRKTSAESLREEIKAQFSVWAHHRDDFLETQILRLIRGVGPGSLYEPMQMLRGSEMRPFLSVSREEIRAYLRDKKIEWLEDPSNQDQDYLRNWLRGNWLPQLEEKCPGALNAFSRSLDLLRESHVDTIPSEIWVQNALSRQVFLGLNEAQKKQVLAQYLRKCGKLDFSQNHIKEIIRQLDNSQLNHTFKSAHVTWSLTRDLIKLD